LPHSFHGAPGGFELPTSCLAAVALNRFTTRVSFPGPGTSSDHPAVFPGPSSFEDPFQDVWPVTLRPKGLGRTRGLGSGCYRLCLGSGTLSLLRKPEGRSSGDIQAPPALLLPLLSVRRCGHADSFFFLELGRSAPMGPGELWLQAPDAVVAQSIHETVLASMKRLAGGGAGGRVDPMPRGPPTCASRPSVPQLYETQASAAQSGGLSRRRCLGERSEQTTLKTLTRLGPAASYPQGLERGRGYITVGARSDYEPMGGGEASGYVVMAPPRNHPGPPPAANAAPRPPLWAWGGTEYEPMSRFPPGSSSSTSLPRSYKPGTVEPGLELQSTHHGVGGSLGLAGAQPRSKPLSELAGEYVRIGYGAPDYVAMGTARPKPSDGRLNYVDLDLVPPQEEGGDAPATGTDRPHSYARTAFQKLWEASSSCSVTREPQVGRDPSPCCC
ncbi:insulin receptor substrate 2-like, partial [Loxodonta africana]|uniref:insulin receptor substrate 2-like n=1 Tax=Loxodonta africana TaxID=9785 RepID=UPI0030CC45EF